MSNRRLVRNPITGEEVLFTPTPRNESSIPKLNFKDLELESGSYRPGSSKRVQNSVKSEYDHFSKRIVQSPIINLEIEQKESARTFSKPAESQLGAPRVEKPQLKPKFIDPTRMVTIEEIQRLWLGDNLLSEAIVIDKHRALKENLVIDTLLTDQLSRPTISEPRPPSSRPQSAHSSRIIPTENTLNNRVKFNCRVRTAHGKNALRELFGIFFMHDGSLTIYEFRQMCGAVFTGIGSGNFSKKANALPFIQRKVYSHVSGRRKHKTIDLNDIFKGSILYLPHENDDVIELQITDVDEIEKSRMISSLIKSLSKEDVTKAMEKFENPYLDDELDDLRLNEEINNKIRRQIEHRSITIYMDVGKMLRKIASKPKMTINLTQLESVLNNFNIKLSHNDLTKAWSTLDFDAKDSVSYYKIMRCFFGEMNVTRNSMFRELMHKLDPLKSGFVKISDIEKCLKIRQHALVKTNQIYEKDFLDTFLNLFDIKSLESAFNFQSEYGSKFVSFEQFEEFYNGLSLLLDSDKDFISIIKNSWNSL